MLFRPAWFRYSISNLKRMKHKNTLSIENFRMTWWTWCEMLTYVHAKVYKRMSTCSLTGCVLDGWTSEVFQPLFFSTRSTKKTYRYLKRSTTVSQNASGSQLIKGIISRFWSLDRTETEQTEQLWGCSHQHFHGCSQSHTRQTKYAHKSSKNKSGLIIHLWA